MCVTAQDNKVKRAFTVTFHDAPMQQQGMRSIWKSALNLLTVSLYHGLSEVCVVCCWAQGCCLLFAAAKCILVHYLAAVGRQFRWASSMLHTVEAEVTLQILCICDKKKKTAHAIWFECAVQVGTIGWLRAKRSQDIKQLAHIYQHIGTGHSLYIECSAPPMLASKHSTKHKAQGLQSACVRMWCQIVQVERGWFSILDILQSKSIINK